MNWFGKLNIRLLLCTCLLLVVFTAADAYVLQGEHVLQLMIEKNNLPVRMRINQQISFFDPGALAAEPVNPEAVPVSKVYGQRALYRIPEAYRSDIDAVDLKRIQVVSADDSLTVIDGRISALSENWTDHYKDIFIYRSRKRLVEKLETLGINFSVTSLGRYNGTICYIIGAEYQDESVPQLWVSKDSFQPVRWIFEVYVEQGVVEQKEILYGDWNSYYSSRYPSKIEFFEGKNLIQSIAVSQVEVNPPFSEDLFDIEQIKRFYSIRTREEVDTTGQNDIEKRIKEFKKIYE